MKKFLKNILITSPIEYLYPKSKKNKIIFSNENILENYNGIYKKYLDFAVSKSNWNKKKNIINNLKYFYSTYEKILEILCQDLNNLHKKKYSKKFWRIFIGPWLFAFILFILSKWFEATKVIKTYRIHKTYYLKFKKNQIASEYKHAIQLFHNPYYVQKINQKILNFFLKKKQIITIKQNLDFKFNFKIKKISFLQNIINKLKNNNRFFISYFGLNILDNIFLNINLKQFPNSILFYDYISKKKKSDNLRKNLLKFFKKKNKFENCLIELIKDELPLCYVEDFNSFEHWCDAQTYLPKNPKIICSSQMLYINSLSQFFVAKSTEKGTKLFYRQHGSSYGMTKYNSGEIHERLVSDKFCTWGWNEKEKKPKNNLIESGIKFSKHKKIFKEVKKIIVTTRQKKSSIISAAIGSYLSYSFYDYLKYVEQLLEKLNENIKKKILIRFPPGVNFKTQDFFGKLKLFSFSNKEKFYKLLKENNLFIHTCHSTTFLETLAHNCPTIGIWDEKEFILKKNYKKFYDRLKSVGIIFTNRTQAIEFLNNLDLKKINLWWGSKKLQKIKNQYVKYYANIENFNYRNVKKQILSVCELKEFKI